MFMRLFIMTLIMILVLCVCGQIIYSLIKGRHKNSKEENNG